MLVIKTILIIILLHIKKNFNKNLKLHLAIALVHYYVTYGYSDDDYTPVMGLYCDLAYLNKDDCWNSNYVIF